MRILHLLNWKLSDVDKILEKVKEQNFDAVQINPLQPLKEDNFDNWWLSYQPCDLSIGNQYGSRDDLKMLCEDAHYLGIQVYADVICTHVAGGVNGELEPHEKVNSQFVNNKYLWREKKQISNWENRREIINYCAGLPSFNMQNYDLQNKVIDMLNDYIDLGIDGFRFDSAKSIPTPYEGCDFWIRVLSSLKRDDLYNYGEVIFADEELINMYKDYIDVLTNTWSRSFDNVVVFTESHDSFYEFGYTKNMTSKEVTKNYSELTKIYPKTIYFARSFDDEWMSKRVREANEIRNKKILQIHL